ncbi:hypothetical protein U9M48_001779 [Paspalum notatum var. saurae]|uniref:Uncharacterized protein n=1 Tax=Paspalum notatum var. saurae TaxID=547442 RepID=A0AAQ3SFG3_PASNO
MFGFYGQNFSTPEPPPRPASVAPRHPPPPPPPRRRPPTPRPPRSRHRRVLVPRIPLQPHHRAPPLPAHHPRGSPFNPANMPASKATVDAMLSVAVSAAHVAADAHCVVCKDAFVLSD